MLIMASTLALYKFYTVAGGKEINFRLLTAAFFLLSAATSCTRIKHGFLT